MAILADHGRTDGLTDAQDDYRALIEKSTFQSIESVAFSESCSFILKLLKLMYLIENLFSASLPYNPLTAIPI